MYFTSIGDTKNIDFGIGGSFSPHLYTEQRARSITQNYDKPRVCNSHHVREDELERTYAAAIKQMTDDAQGIIDAVSEGAMLVLEPENKARLKDIESAIVETQEKALELHKDKIAGNISEAEYEKQIAACSERMINLEQQQKTLNTVATRYSEIRNWLDTFAEHTRNGDITDAGDAMVMKTLVEKIIVKDEGIEVVCKCGVTIEQKYV